LSDAALDDAAAQTAGADGCSSWMCIRRRSSDNTDLLFSADESI
jgi:hypothetical protein